MRSNLRGNSGAPADTASTSRPISTPGAKVSSLTSAKAASGTPTYIASTERSSRPGRCSRWVASLTVESMPMARMIKPTEAFSSRSNVAVMV